MTTAEIKAKLEESCKGIEFSKRTKFIAFCMASFYTVKRWEENPLPASMKGEKPTQRVYIVPEVSHSFGEKEAVQDTADKLEKNLGEGFEVVVFATHNDMVIAEDNFILVKNI